VTVGFSTISTELVSPSPISVKFSWEEDGLGVWCIFAVFSFVLMNMPTPVPHFIYSKRYMIRSLQDDQDSSQRFLI
jgi:hypothetical protein